MISERDLDGVLRGYSSYRDATTTQSTATSSAWIRTAQPDTYLLIRLGNRSYGVGATLMPTWLRPTLKSIAQLLKLQFGWDSYGGQLINQRAVKTTMEVLTSVMDYDSPVPAVVPTSAGGLQLEWHRGGSDLEITVVPSGEATFDFGNAGGEEIEGNVFEQTRTVADLISHLPK